MVDVVVDLENTSIFFEYKTFFEFVTFYLLFITFYTWELSKISKNTQKYPVLKIYYYWLNS
jgi:hypothetical protein